MHTPGRQLRHLDQPAAPYGAGGLSASGERGALGRDGSGLGTDIGHGVGNDSVGQRLRRRREELGESLDNVVRDTRLSRQAIEALEADDYPAISSDFYVRGFLKIYARYLEFDPEAVLDAYERQTSVSRLVHTGEVEDGEQVPTYFQTQAPSPTRSLSPAQIFLLVITAATLVVFMLSVNRSKPQRPEVARRPAVTAPETPATANTGVPGVLPPQADGQPR